MAGHSMENVYSSTTFSPHPELDDSKPYLAESLQRSTDRENRLSSALQETFDPEAKQKWQSVAWDATRPEVLTLAEAARILRCSKAHLCNVLNGRVSGLLPLPHIRVGRRKLIRRASLMGWMAALETQGELQC